MSFNQRAVINFSENSCLRYVEVHDSMMEKGQLVRVCVCGGQNNQLHKNCLTTLNGRCRKLRQEKNKRRQQGKELCHPKQHSLENKMLKCLKQLDQDKVRQMGKNSSD